MLRQTWIHIYLTLAFDLTRVHLTVQARLPRFRLLRRESATAKLSAGQLKRQRLHVDGPGEVQAT